MRALPVEFSESAEADLDAIETWIAERVVSAAVARRYGDRIRRRCAKIGLVPRGGWARSGQMSGLRSVSFERSATIFYAVETDRVLVLRILRRGRDVERAFTP